MTFDFSVLGGLDDVAWASFEHAYGPADDVPELLRALVGDDEELAEEAVHELYGNIWHQGSVYPATVPAVPYLVEIAVSGLAGGQTPEVLRLLGHIAGSSDPRGVQDPDAVRSAVAAHAGVLAGLLDDVEASTRAAALFVLVQAAPAERVRPLILQRWHAETEAVPRAEALHAMMHVDADTAADLADELLSAGASAGPPDDCVLVVSSALAWIRAGRPMDERVRDAALTPISAGSELWHRSADGELFEQLIKALAERQGAPAAVELLTEALDRAREAPAELVERYLSAARWLIVSFRSAPEALAAPIARLLDRPELARGVVALLALIGPAVAAPAARDRLAALAGAEPGSDDADLADEALACLAHWNDPIVPALLARALRDRPRTLDVVAESAAVRGDALPFDPDLLAAIRRRLAEICQAGQEPSGHGDNPFVAVPGHNEPVQLAEILTAWGDRAGHAVPELIRLLALRPTVAAPALAAIGPQSLEGVAMLRRVAQTVDDRGAVRARLAGAQAIRTLTQDSGPLLSAVRFGLSTQSTSPDDRAAAAEAAGDLPDHAGLLVPLLLQALQAIPVPTPSLPAHQARLKIGRALWLLTDRPEHAIDVLRNTLDLAGELFTSWTVATAADLAAEIGPAARELATSLEAALADPVACPAAAQALLAVAPQGPWWDARRAELIEHLLAALVAGRVPTVRTRALDVLSGFTPLPPRSAEKLRAIADRDERFPLGLQDTEHLHSDDQLRARIRALLQEGEGAVRAGEERVGT